MMNIIHAVEDAQIVALAAEHKGMYLLLIDK